MRFKGIGVYYFMDEWLFLLLLFGNEKFKIFFKISFLNFLIGGLMLFGIFCFVLIDFVYKIGGCVLIFVYVVRYLVMDCLWKLRSILKIKILKKERKW